MARGEVTEGQVLLYAYTCFSGQLLNSGFDGFMENCPGLISDVRFVLEIAGLTHLHKLYCDAAAPVLEVLDRYAAETLDATGEALNPMWAEFENALDQLNSDYVDRIESLAYASDRDQDPSNPFRLADLKIAATTLARGSEFFVQ